MRKELLGLKVLAIVLASLLWLQSALVEEHKTTVNLPVQLINSPKDISIENPPDRIPFVVQGKGIELFKLALNKPYISLDASGLRPGQDLLSLNSYKIIVPENIHLQMIGPASSDDIRVNADSHREKRVPINLSFANDQLRRDFGMKSIQINPDNISISGPSSIVDEIRSINTIQLERSHLNMTSFRIALDLPVGVSTDAREIRVIINTNPDLTRVLSSLNLRSEDRERFFPNKINVKIRGEGEKLDSLRQSSVNILVSETPDSDGYHRVIVRLPQGLELVDVSPNRLRAVD